MPRMIVMSDRGLIKQVETVVGSSGSADRKCLKPGDEFTDCDGCPAMVVVPSGSFTMGSPRSENERSDDEGPHARRRPT